ncbi:hypothetical protein [Mycobacterium botniense]|uniref:DUF222 domain-containing protein n=1 Tax=Mycobacterium botniense TaxID=84962 RepID=A0A7I9XXW7_9MYCO|nr:hypothetical protein [Mycobacterium botniense]GFG74618.1 hypothetical protein MBOT_19830 [Mycobacterium botniense]
MTELASMTDEELLRQSIREILAGFPPREAGLLLNNMYAGGAIADRPSMLAVWNEELSPEQAELDLHLTGEGIRDHSARADQLARLVSGINDATKAIVRDKLGLRSLNRNLLVEGVAPGSVHVVLRADAPIEASGTEPMRDVDASSPDSVALRTVARVFTVASSDEPSVSGDLRSMPARARAALRRAVVTVSKANWEIDGEIRQRTYGADPVRLSRRGAVELLHQLAAHNYTTETNPRPNGMVRD